MRTDTMQALVLVGPSRFSLEEVPVPTIEPDEVLVRVRACGICGSDVKGMTGSTGRREPPLVMGHEASGTLAVVGAAVDGWAPGDRVTFDSTLACGACRACRSGRPNLCACRRILGSSFDGARTDGAFAEYVAVPARALARVPEELGFPTAAFAEPLGVAVHAVRRAQVRPGASVAVVGCGVIGLLATQVLRAEGVGAVTAVDPVAERRALARDAGAGEALVPDALPRRSFDVVIEAVGTGSAIRSAIDAAAPGGRVVLVGNLEPTVEIPLQAVVTAELDLAGSCALGTALPVAVELLATGAVDVASLLSVVAPLADGAAWFARLAEGGSDAFKVVLDPALDAGA